MGMSVFTRLFCVVVLVVSALVVPALAVATAEADTPRTKPQPKAQAPKPSPLAFTPPPAETPLLVYYDTFEKRNPDLNAALVVGGEAETLFSESWGDTPFAVGGSIPCTNVNASILTLDLAKEILGKVPYLTVDELRTDKTCKESCVSIVQGLVKAGMGGRIIFYIRYDKTGDHWDELTPLITLCATGACRKIMFETYPWILTTSTTTKDTLAQFRDKIADHGHGNTVAAPVIGISNNARQHYLNDPRLDIDNLNAHLTDARDVEPDWHGAGFYAPAYDGPTSYYTVAQLVAAMRSMTMVYAHGAVVPQVKYWYCPRDPACVDNTMSVGDVRVSMTDAAPAPGTAVALKMNGTTTLRTVPPHGTFRVYSLAGHNVAAGPLPGRLELYDCSAEGCKFGLAVNFELGPGCFTPQGWLSYTVDMFLGASGGDEGICVVMGNPDYAGYERKVNKPPPGFVTYCDHHPYGHVEKATSPVITWDAIVHVA